jgi:hypothetical protein
MPFRRLVNYKCGLVTAPLELPKGAQPRGGNLYYLDEICTLCRMYGHHGKSVNGHHSRSIH